MNTRYVVLLAPLTLASAACGSDTSGPTATARKNLAITVAVSHTHVMKMAEIPFSVRDMDTCTNPLDATTCAGVPGLTVTAFHRFSKDTADTDYAMGAGVLQDGGDGTYKWMHQFGMVGANMIGLRFTLDGNLYEGSFPFETSRAGGEGYQCDLGSDGSVDHVFQVRWDPSGWPVMGDGTELTYSIELQRSFSTPVNTDQPWTNKFDHLMPSELENEAPTVKLMMGQGESAHEMETLTATYAGKGIYQVKRAFTSADAHGTAESTYWFKVELTDMHGCSVTTGATEADRANYYFPVMPH